MTTRPSWLTRLTSRRTTANRSQDTAPTGVTYVPAPTPRTDALGERQQQPLESGDRGAVGRFPAHLGIDPVWNHLERLRGEAIATGHRDRAAELEETLVMITDTVESFAWLAAQNERPELDAAPRQLSERRQLHDALHEYVFQFGIELPAAALDPESTGNPAWLRDVDELLYDVEANRYRSGGDLVESAGEAATKDGDREAVEEAETGDAPTDEAAATDEVRAWIDLGASDLGHNELVARVQARAVAAYDAGANDTFRQLDDVAEWLIENAWKHELTAIQTAVTLPETDRQGYLDSQQAELRQEAQRRIAHLVDDLDLTTAVPLTEAAAAQAFEQTQQLQHLERVDDDVRIAYDSALATAQAADGHDASGESGTRWLSLTDLRAELARQARRDGHEPHTNEEIDAALQRLTLDQVTKVHVIPEDHGYLLTDKDREAAARFGGADRHMILIEDPGDSSAEEQRLVDLSEQADFAEMNAERLDDADQPAQAAQFRADAAQCRREAQQLAHDNGLDHLYDDGDEAADEVTDANDQAGAARVPDLSDETQLRQEGRRLRELAVEAERIGDMGRGDELREFADEVTWLPADWDGSSRTQLNEVQQLFLGRAEHEPVSAERDSAEEAAAEAASDDADELTPADEASPDDAASDDDGIAASAKDGDENAAEVQPVAVTETTACTVAVTRARCAVERVQQQLDAEEQETAAERDDELARWHADDTTAQVENERVVDAAAQLDSAPVRGE